MKRTVKSGNISSDDKGITANKKSGRIFSINISKEKGERKFPVREIVVTKYGLKGDIHCGNWGRQVSLISYEVMEGVNKKGINLKPGDFAENITTQEVDLQSLKIGDLIIIKETPKDNKEVIKYSFDKENDIKSDNDNKDVILKVTQIGKESENSYNENYMPGLGIMSSIGIFCRVIKTGRIKVGYEIYIKDLRD